MSAHDLAILADHADQMLTNTDTTPPERDLWRSIGREIRAYLGDDDQPVTQDEELFPAPTDKTIRVLIAPCGCMCAADVSTDVIGFARTVSDKREDDADGYTERRIPITDFQRTAFGCDHDPKWGVPPQ